MVWCETGVLRTHKNTAAEYICGCAFCIPATVQTDGFDSCPQFLREYEVCCMEVYFVVG